MRSTLLLRIAIGLVSVASQASAAGYDLAQDFSKTSNPAGAWSYGYRKNLGGAFLVEAKKETNKGVDYWTAPTGGNPFTSHNDTGAVVTIGTTRWQPGMVVSHPGPLGEYQDNRLTLADAGSYWLVGSFAGVDTHGATSDVYIVADGLTIFSGFVTGVGDDSQVRFSFERTFAAGTTLDFIVGTGDGDYLFDAVAVAANVTPVPEPATYLMLALGLFAVGRVRSRNAAERWP